MKKEKSYIAIDLKSFYASVECVERGLDPLCTNLVVADESRTEKTICLAVSPSLKSFGIPGRERLYRVIETVKSVNLKRKWNAPGHKLSGSSCNINELNANRSLELDYIVAKPRMALYMKYSTQVYSVYLKYISAEDIHIYSIDEVFIDATNYLDLYKMSARELAQAMIKDIFETTGITATAGIGTNLYLCKVAMDIVAKHAEPDEYGARIAELDEMSYRKTLWSHKPLTDFWRVGSGYAKRLEQAGLYTMGDVALCSLGKENEYYNEELLYKLFGVNAEFLIDHAWGCEPCEMAEIKKYRPKTSSICSGQVLKCPYDFEKARIIVREMADAMALDLVGKELLTDKITLTVGYDVENLNDPTRRASYSGAITTDRYGRQTPKHGHGTSNLEKYTSSSKNIVDTTLELFDRICDRGLLIRRINISAERLITCQQSESEAHFEQFSLFENYEEKLRREAKEKESEKRERSLQKTMLDIKARYGKNAILKGTSFIEGATGRERNREIGGHRA